MKLRKQTSGLSAQIHRQAVCFSPQKYCKNLPSWNSSSMEMGPSGGRNCCPAAQERCYIPDICTVFSCSGHPGYGNRYNRYRIGPKSTSHPSAHPDTHPAHSMLSVSHWKQAPCSRACVLGSSLQGTEPTVDNWEVGTVSN